MVKRTYELEELRLLTSERDVDAGLRWDDKADCGHSRADMLAARGGSVHGGPSTINLDTKCEACKWDIDFPELKPEKVNFGIAVKYGVSRVELVK